MIAKFDCACCRLEYHQASNRPIVIVYNGEVFRGWDQFAEAVGLSMDLAKGRTKKGVCLRKPVRVTTRGWKPKALVNELSRLMAGWR